MLWEARFKYDTDYVKHITFIDDFLIIVKTAIKVLKSSDVQVRGTGSNIDFDKYRINQKAEEEITN